MKSSLNTLRGVVLASTLGTPVFAGEPAIDLPPIEAVAGEPDVFKWLTPSVNLRTRYEFRNEGGLDSANSVTVRGRLGLTLGSFNGFSAFGEIEATTPLVDDFDAGPGNTTPNNPGQTVIADPENVELNRAWIQYKKDGLLAKVGRQRIIRNDSFHIGNVGWRQNEQTFDAAQLAYTTDDFSLSYVYSNAARRIFGNFAGGAAEEFSGDFHFVDASYNSAVGKLGAYAYLIDVDNNANVGRSNTYGAFGTFGPLYLEAAFQEGDSNLAGGDGSYDAFLARVNYTLKTDAGNFSAGIDWTQDDYKTPFQTAHAFFGWADSFLAQQVGLNKANGFDGIFDGHLKYAKTGLPGGITFKAALHYFASADLDTTYGYEADMLLVKKFSDNLTGLVKAAYFVGDDAFPDIQQVTVDLSYTF